MVLDKKTKIRNVERSRFVLYNEPQTTDFILKFFEMENPQAARCRAWTKDVVDKKLIIARYENQRLISLTRNNIMKQLFGCHTTYFYEFLFNKDTVGSAIAKTQKKGQIIGITPVMDIDAPTIYENKGTKNEVVLGRESIFQYIDDFNSTIEIIDSELKECGYGYKMTSSGNGVYIIGDPFYSDDIKEIYQHADDYSDLINDVNNVKENGLGIHDSAKAWSYYYKIPFTFHVGRQRFSIPLKKGKLDGEWIDKVTNITDLNMNNVKSVIGDIIKRSDWKWP